MKIIRFVYIEDIAAKYVFRMQQVPMRPNSVSNAWQPIRLDIPLMKA